MSVEATTDWRSTFPGASVGCLLMHGVSNAERSAALDERLAALQTHLRESHASADRAALANLPAIRAYQAHYRPFGQTYHVLRQLESVALKGRDLRSPGGTLVSAMFAAELSSLLLTAGHDVDALAPPLVVDGSKAGDRFVGINGQARELKPGDMLMRDGQGIISAVLNGPDQRTRLSERTRRALFVTYAPAGIARADIDDHFDQIVKHVRLVDPRAEEIERIILSA
ncbi:MAG TPA: phenylalanine--tRNA ligase beta subunit-related protein [Chloroflexota bacterium]|nr:phenylalanine--tRNA ligase beta subunit-related protein [Chloroflexota bacterium]